MPDKLKKTYPLRITFSDGELPTSAKLSAISEQARNGLALVEAAIGDPWTQSGENMLGYYPLQIPNLARMLGENKYLNPVIYPMDDDFTFTEDIGDAHTGLNEFHLTYKPKAGTQATITVTGTNITGSSQTDERDVNADGEYWVDVTTGRFRSYQALSGDETIIYTVDPSEWLIGEETLPGIIPDPRQADFTSCRVSLSGGVYTLHLPPRLPLTLDSTSERPASYPKAADVAANSADIIADNKFWQKATVNAFTGVGSARYRYALPQEIQDRLSSGNEIPAGFLHLYNKSTGTVIEDVVFTIPTSPTGYTLEISSDSFDFDTVDTSDETEISYNASNLVLITCGAPVTRTVWSLMSALFMHKHEKGTTLDATISHSDLDDFNPPSDDYYTGEDADHKDRYPTHLPAWFPSNWNHDPHTSLLSRAGSQASGYERDLFNNAMLGDLLIANADTSGAENYLDGTLPDDSFKIYFGDVTGPSIYADSSGLIRFTAGLKFSGISGTCVHATSVSNIGIYGASGSNYGVQGLSATSYGVYGYSTNSHGIVAEGKASSPSDSSLRIVPQDLAPDTPVEGDVYVNSTIHGLEVYLNDGWGRTVSQVAATTTLSNIVTGTTSETDFDQQYEIPAGSLRVGDTIRIRALINVISINGTPDLTIRPYLDTNGFGAIVFTTSGSTDFIAVDWTMVVLALGAAGDVTGWGTVSIMDAEGAVGLVHGDMIVDEGVDTTGALAVKISAEWDAVHATNKVQLHHLIVDIQ